MKLFNIFKKIKRFLNREKIKTDWNLKINDMPDQNPFIYEEFFIPGPIRFAGPYTYVFPEQTDKNND